jgi:hypothetical protein
MAEDVQGLTATPSYQAVGTPREVLLSELGGLFTAQLDPQLYTLARMGRIFHAVHTVATAVVPLQVVPSTTAALVVNNVDTSTPNRLVVPLFAGCWLASGTAGIGVSLFGLSTSTALATQLSANTSGVTVGCSRGGSDAPNSYVGLSKTVAGNWSFLGSVDVSAAAVPGTGTPMVPLHGLFVVRPTYAFGLHAVAGAGTTAAFSFAVIWAEIPGTAP